MSSTNPDQVIRGLAHINEKCPPPADASRIFWYYGQTYIWYADINYAHELLEDGRIAEVDEILHAEVPRVELDAHLAEYCLLCVIEEFDSRTARGKVRFLPYPSPAPRVGDLAVGLQALEEQVLIDGLQIQMTETQKGMEQMKSAASARVLHLIRITRRLLQYFERQEYAEMGALLALFHLGSTAIDHASCMRGLLEESHEWQKKMISPV